MREEAYITLFGTEMSIKPVVAFDYISAKNRYSFAQNSGESVSALLFWADIIEKCLFDGENKAFESSEEVLKKLSLEDISRLSQMISIPEISVPTSDATDNLPQSMEKQSLDELSDMRERLILGGGGNETVYNSSAFSVNVGASPESTVDYQRISDYFERDSRRYTAVLKSEATI